MHNTDLITDSILDPSIIFNKDFAFYDYTNPKAIFLTGATGLVGAYLLDELMNKTKADLYCLVRCNSQDEGKERIKKNLLFNELWQEKFSSRIIPVIGDLSKNFLGLSEQSFYKLADIIDVIYHNGAYVNFVYPYSALKATNVLGTHEVIRLASCSRVKPLHFVSTVAVFFTKPYFNQQIIKETDIPQFDDSLKGGYKQSKWVAEQLIINAQKIGMPASIYRPVRILGSSKTGITSNFNDTLCQLLKACIELKKYPDLDTLIILVPVDYVGQAIVNLSLQKKSINKAFHISNTSPISLKDFFKEVYNSGYDMEEAPYSEWIEELQKISEQKHKETAYSFLFFFLRNPNNLLLQKMEFELNNTLEGLANTSIVCPKTDKKLILTYIKYFQKIGYIPMPCL